MPVSDSERKPACKGGEHDVGCKGCRRRYTGRGLRYWQKAYRRRTRHQSKQALRREATS